MATWKSWTKGFLAVALAAQMSATAWAQEIAAHRPVPAKTQGFHISAPVEPQNLGLLKTKLKQYHDCCYAVSLVRQDSIAMMDLERAVKLAKRGKKPAICWISMRRRSRTIPRWLRTILGLFRRIGTRGPARSKPRRFPER